jgi:hypothetical protein
VALHGSCLCRGVRYEIDGALALPGHCHCSICRKTHGAAFATYASAKRSEFRLLAGEDLLSRYESTPGSFRCFCSRCGSRVCGMFAGEPDTIAIALGTLDEDPQIRPVAHVFVGSKAPWYEITDDLMQFDAWPPGMGPEQT